MPHAFCLESKERTHCSVHGAAQRLLDSNFAYEETGPRVTENLSAGTSHSRLVTPS